jgi:serine/threonine protein kinase
MNDQDRQRYERLHQIFEGAIDLDDPGERATFLDEACGADVDLRSDVDALLRGANNTLLPGLGDADIDRRRVALEGQISHPDHTAGLTRTPPPMLEQVGAYRIIRVIGQGGMGVVYEARQESPQRTVALKVISPGIMSDELLRRFKYEADVLGRLQHPHIPW